MKIIVIEDDPTLANLIQEIVHPLGQVSVAHTMETAMLEIKDAPEGSLMLWDLRLGDSDAENTANVIRGLKAKDPKAPIVIVSGLHVIPETGADAVVRKGGSMDFSGDLYRAIISALTDHPGYEKTIELIQRVTAEKGFPLDMNPRSV